MICSYCNTIIAGNCTVCPTCGARYSIEKTHKHQRPVVTNANEAIRIYLSNIIYLESIKSKIYDDYCYYSDQLQYEEYRNLVESKDFSNGCIWLYYSGSEYFVGCFEHDGKKRGYNGGFLNIDLITKKMAFSEPVMNGYIKIHEGNFFWARLNDENMPRITEASFWTDHRGKNIFEDKMYQIKARDAFLKAYQEFRQYAPARYNENLINKINPLKNTVDKLANEWHKANDLLQNAYNINIVPVQYRNVNAIYYIHNFISTSNESLSTALLHYDIDEIKQKLDKIISQNRQRYINEALIMSQNEQLMNQNQQKLNYLANVEQNTQEAKKYAQIAANNSEFCSWLCLTSYF